MGLVPGWVSAQIGDLLDEERPEEALELLEEWGEKRPNHPALLFYTLNGHNFNFLRGLKIQY